MRSCEKIDFAVNCQNFSRVFDLQSIFSPAPNVFPWQNTCRVELIHNFSRVSELRQTANRASHEATASCVLRQQPQQLWSSLAHDNCRTGTRSSSVPHRPHSRVSGMTGLQAAPSWLADRLTSLLRDTGTGSLTFVEVWWQHFPNQGRGPRLRCKRHQSPLGA